MGTVANALKAVSGYPISAHVIQGIALARGLDHTTEATTELLGSKEYRLAKADTLRWVSFAPNTSQGGVSFDLLFSDRELMRAEANTIYGALGDPLYQPKPKPRYGYKGVRL